LCSANSSEHYFSIFFYIFLYFSHNRVGCRTSSGCSPARAFPYLGLRRTSWLGSE
jgi:hypothetical protein